MNPALACSNWFWLVTVCSTEAPQLPAQWLCFFSKDATISAGLNSCAQDEVAGADVVSQQDTDAVAVFPVTSG